MENNGIKTIEKQMDTLKASILERFEKQAKNIRADQERYMEAYSAQLRNEKDKLLKEIDDRLALIKQFPSVLDADKVYQFESGLHNEYRLRDNWGQQEIYFEEGNWKILVLAKRIAGRDII